MTKQKKETRKGTSVYGNELRKAVALDYISGLYPTRFLVEKYKLPNSDYVYNFYRWYAKNHDIGLEQKSNKRCKVRSLPSKEVWSDAVRQAIVADYEAGVLSSSAIMAKYGLRERYQIHDFRAWYARRYGNSKSLGSSTGSMKKIEQSNERAFKASVDALSSSSETAGTEDLALSLVAAKLKIEALEALLDYAEQTYKLPIRKKAGGGRLKA